MNFSICADLFINLDNIKIKKIISVFSLIMFIFFMYLVCIICLFKKSIQTYELSIFEYPEVMQSQREIEKRKLTEYVFIILNHQKEIKATSIY